LRFPKEVGISPLNALFERSSVRSFSSLPIAAGIGPEMALFCSNLHIYASTNCISMTLLWNYAIRNQQREIFITFEKTPNSKQSAHSLLRKKLKVRTYTDCRLVRLPMDGDKVPDKL